MLNILSFEVHSLTYLDRPISELDPTTPRQVILLLTGLTNDAKEEKVFITVEKDYNGNY